MKPALVYLDCEWQEELGPWIPFELQVHALSTTNNIYSE